ncbi:MAG TPA: MMPL family transporter [Chthoniobacteraceae bacterium]|nr:MMPL family transporter [Chthoniobacteraceae bacterium]
MSRFIAHFVTHRRPVVFTVVGLLLAASLLVIIFGLHFNSDILDLLPKDFDSVQALKTTDREFTNARQILFAVTLNSQDGDLEDVTNRFCDALRKQPWVVRVTASPPIESADGVADLQSRLAVPLLLNLDPPAFAKAMLLLQPDHIAARLHELQAKMGGMDFGNEMKLNYDALGLVQEAMRPMASSFSNDQSSAFVSEDGTMHLIFVETNQTGIDPHACQALMRTVEAFKAQFLASCPVKPGILITGRDAFVDQISRSMRFDIVSTLLGSVILVSVVFYVGFRRFLPLIALMNVLLLCCVMAIAIGGLIFHELNLITIGLCSILVGLGVDFGMLLYGSYQSHRNAGVEHEDAIARSLRQLGEGIFIGALTTAAAFVSFLLSGCSAFEQLGGLIAIGILIASVMMMTVFYACVSRRKPPEEHDLLFEWGKRYVGRVFRNPKPVLIATTIFLLVLCGIAIAPIGRLKMEADPKTLEPACDASAALETIQQSFPAANEPLLVLVDAANAEQCHDEWMKVQAQWTALVAEHKIKSFISPASFVLSPKRQEANLKTLVSVNLDAARAAYTKALADEGFNASDPTFQNVLKLIGALQAARKSGVPETNWRQILPPASSWWFVLDNFFARNSYLGAAHVTPLTHIRSAEQKAVLDQELTVPGVNMHITGWTYVLADLIPWAKHKLTLLSLVMISFNIVLLAFLYRRVAPLLILMASLALSIGAMIACLKIFGFALNLFNVLAFPLVLGVGVDYGIYILLATRQPGDREYAFATIIKPVILAGLTAVAGFGSLAIAHNPALRGLGVVCAIGIACCLFSTIFFILPAYLLKK